MIRLISVVMAILIAVGSVTAQTTFTLSDSVRFNPSVKVGKLSSGIPYYIM